MTGAERATAMDDGVQCAARRPVSGGRLGIAVLLCYLADSHDGPHFDATEGIEWMATRLPSCGSIHQDALAGAKGGAA